MAAGTAAVAYAAGVEVNLYRLRRFSIPLLDPGEQPLRILQVSDIHMVPGQRRKQAWLRSLAELQPDLVVNTGDNLSHPDAVPEVIDTLEPLTALPGVFVLGSNDYYQASRLNPAKYLRHGDRSHAPRRKRAENDWPALQAAFTKAGWLDLTNARSTLDLPGRGLSLDFVGVDDPHVRRDRYPAKAGPDGDAHEEQPVPHSGDRRSVGQDSATHEGQDEGAGRQGIGHSAGRTRTTSGGAGRDLTIGVTHAPYLRVLDAMTTEGVPLILAGHTHGGQLCVPFYGALVTNCDLDRARAKGLHTHAVGGNTAHLHVSAGCGASRYAPVRFACPPEASLITLLPRAG
ncbi:metallophosphoesterase [Actinocrinis puniceicyclus]|uniref:Metallophosphoesterase n=2 Tax=Actinocrinis puniceicyclus TaxID=977794 RepID=A0A8J7WKX8_9ACTN|nr:metallophosphoesterase [Actinocrinis puniceicyclus]